ncbi:MAG: LysM peptidoglycan-binding protein [Verrucomicrobiales bacterium]|nr:LysM peptidoglycan-binding protein [Verrucomicrobiales bacterium]
MARVYLRILAALFALGVLAATVFGAFYIYRETYLPERARTQEVKEMLSSSAPKADPGRKQFDQAMEAIRQGDFEAARRQLVEITEVYRDSTRYQDSRRVLGEMNLDRLFSRAPMPGKLEYTAVRGDNLVEIAKRFRSTIAFIKRVNNLLGNIIHPDDRLILYPLDFSIEVDLAGNRFTLLKDGRYFKDYAITGRNLTHSKLPEQTVIGDKPAWLDGKKIRLTDEQYSAARKWLQTAGAKAGTSGVIFCPAPRAAEPAAVGAAPGKFQENPPGIYLSEDDIEELSTLVRVGTPLQFLKTAAPAPAPGAKN